MSAMVTKLLEMYRFDMDQQVNGQGVDREKQCCSFTFLAKREC